MYWSQIMLNPKMPITPSAGFEFFRIHIGFILSCVYCVLPL